MVNILTKWHNKYFSLLLTVYIVPTVILFFIVNKTEPDVIMDEMFHVGQSQNYCAGNFAWNPYITTLPGLYATTVGGIKLLENILQLDIPCSTFNLRFFNVICNILNFMMIFLILRRRFPNLSDAKAAVSALNLGMFPLLYFFTFIFYTEPLAVFSVLAMHYCWIRKNFYTSSVFGALAIFCRQTNIVWVFFHGLMTFLHVISPYLFNKNLFSPPSLQRNDMNNNSNANSKPNGGLKQRRLCEKENMINCGTIKDDNSITKINSSDYVMIMTKQLMSICKELISSCSGYILVGIAFVAFMIVNNGIVVGDREAHQVRLNSPQMLYFSLFTGFFSLAMFSNMKNVKDSLHMLKNNVKFVSVLYVLTFLMVHFNTVAHHYNLGDSHHLVNIVFVQFYYSPTARYIVLPFYLLFWAFIITKTLKSNDKLFLISFIVTTALNLVPQLMLEFRYFVPAYFVFRLNIIVDTWKELVIEFILYTLVNSIVFWIFLCRPIQFPQDDPMQYVTW